MAFRSEGEMLIPAKLMPSPLCGPARVSGKEFAKPVRRQRRWQVDAYPLNHPLRTQTVERMGQTQRIDRGNTGNFMDTAAARHSTPKKEKDQMSIELEEEWERKRIKYASTSVDTEAEASAVAEIIRFADITGHGKASCFVGHWYYHGEGGLPQSYEDAIKWYEKSADAEYEGGAVARDRMYLDGSGCDREVNELSYLRAIDRLEELGDGDDRAVANAALSRLSIWGVKKEDESVEGETKYNENDEDQSIQSDEFYKEVKPETVGRNTVTVNSHQSELRQDLVSSIETTNPTLAQELNRDKERLSLLRELQDLEKRAQPSNPPSSSSASVLVPPPLHLPTTPFGSGGTSPPRRSSPISRGPGSSELRSAADVANAAPPPSEPRGILEADRERSLALKCVLACKDYDSYMVMLETMKVQGNTFKPPPPLPDDAVTYGILSRDTSKESRKLQALCSSYQPVSTGLKIPKAPPKSRGTQRNSELLTPLSTLRDRNGYSDQLNRTPSAKGGALVGTAPRNPQPVLRSNSRTGINAPTPARNHYTSQLAQSLSPSRAQRNLYTTG